MSVSEAIDMFTVNSPALSPNVHSVYVSVRMLEYDETNSVAL